VSTERERTASLESQVQDLSKTHEKRIDKLEENLLSIQDSPTEIDAIDKRLNEIEEADVRLGDKIARNRLEEMKTAEQMKGLAETLDHVQKKLSSLENLHSRLEKRFDTDRARMDEYLKQSLAEREEVEKDMKEQRERLGEIIKAMKQ
jgi:chromosome segregation ATPase